MKKVLFTVLALACGVGLDAAGNPSGVPKGFRAFDAGTPEEQETAGGRVLRYRWDVGTARRFTGKVLCVAFRAKGAGAVKATLSRAVGKGGTVEKAEPFADFGTSLSTMERPFLFAFGPGEKMPAVSEEMNEDGDLETVERMDYPEIKGATLELTAPVAAGEVKFFLGEDFPDAGTNPHLQKGGKLPAGYAVGRQPPPHGGLEDLTALATEVQVSGFETRLGQMTDGAFGTYSREPTEFRFDTPVEVAAFAVTLPAGYSLLYADTDGDGVCETVLDESAGLPKFSTWGDLPEYVWRTVTLKSPVMAKKLVYFGGAHEARIYGTPLAKIAPTRFVLPEAPVLAAKGSPDRTVKETDVADRLYFGFSVESWMFGSQRVFTDYYQKKADVPPITEWKEWNAMMDDFAQLNANFMLLFPPKTSVDAPGVKKRGTYSSAVLWPSEVWYLSQPFDVLKDLVADTHKRGMKTFVTPREWIFKPQEEGCPERPQVVYATEISARQADGVPTCVDEHAMGTGGFLPKAERKPCEDTAEWRAHLCDGYRRHAGYMAEIKQKQLANNPNGLTFGAYAGCDHFKDRIACVSGCDWWGFEGKVDVIGGDGTYFGHSDRPWGSFCPYVESAVQVSCSAKRLSMATVNFNWGTRWDEATKRMKNPLVYDDFPNVAHSGGALATFFAKGKFLDFWRYNFMDMKGPETREAVSAGGFMTKKLAEWGGWKAQVPKDVLVLRSRTSEDWWSLRSRFGELPFAGSREDVKKLGFSLFFFSACNLCADAVPFEIYLLNRPETWRDRVQGYKVVVLPFAYAISDEAAQVLKAAAEAGVKIVAPGEYPFAGADDTGALRKAGALEGVPVERIAFNPAAGVNEPQFFADFRAAVAQALAAKGGASLTLARDPRHDVQAYELEVSAMEKLVMVANWSERETAVNLGVRVPAGDYRLDVCDGSGVRTGTVGGRETFDANAAASFRIALKPEETLLLRIRK